MIRRQILRREVFFSSSLLIMQISLTFALIGCQSPSGENHEVTAHESEEAAGDHDEETVSLSPAELEEFGIEIETAGKATIETYLQLPGEVQPNADRLAHIVPRFAGVVKDVRARVGDEVQPGQILAIIESSASLSSFELKTVIGGIVIAKHITPGEAISTDGVAYTVADLSNVWVDLTVYQRDLGRVRIGQKTILTVGQTGPTATGKISYVSPVVDESTRTATARLVIPNRLGQWRPGVFVTAKVLVNSSSVEIGVSRSALHTIDDESVVFVETDDGFVPRPVELGQAGESRFEILSGLEPGDRYVSEGGFTLKAALATESFGGGHAH